jgi:hypothetical protein
VQDDTRLLLFDIMAVVTLVPSGEEARVGRDCFYTQLIVGFKVVIPRHGCLFFLHCCGFIHVNLLNCSSVFTVYSTKSKRKADSILSELVQ